MLSSAPRTNSPRELSDLRRLTLIRRLGLLVLAGLPWYVVSGAVAHSIHPADPELNVRGRAILDYFHQLQGSSELKLVSGQFCSFGPTARIEAAQKLFTATGHWPALVSVDYTDFSSHWLDTRTPNRLLLAYWRQGGLVSVGVHLNNPASPAGGGQRDHNIRMAELLVPGTAVHQRWLLQLDALAAGLQELQAAGVVVLWRPLHEMNGDWFWWGSQEPADFIKVWRQMYDYFTHTKGLHNLIWVYSPNMGHHAADYFGGDAYVDLVGLDCYTDGVDPQHITGFPEVARLGKPVGFTEYGPHGAHNPPGDFDFRRLLDGIGQNFPACRFFLCWDDKWNPAENRYAREFYQDSRVITRDRLPVGLAGADPSAIADDARRELQENILPFWLKNARDLTEGGFLGQIDQQMRIDPAAAKGSLLTSRLLWAFSAAYRRDPRPEYLEMARYAYRDLSGCFSDREFGGLYWSVDRHGQPLDQRKQVYGQVFGLYALTEYSQASGDPEALEQAKALFRLIDRQAHDPRNGGYFDVLDRQWRRVDERHANILGPAPKTQNSHIHILEAFTNLLRVWPDPDLQARQRELIGLLLDRMIDSHTHHLVLFLTEDWKPLSAGYSYGHDIELSWLLTEAAEVLGDPAMLARVKTAALAMAEATLAEGIDADGSIFNEGGPSGVTDAGKDWWAQAEAAVGFLNAYQLSGDPRYFAASRRCWNYIQDHFVDHANGDWYESLQRDGTPKLRFKQSVWKCPYHNSRACLELMQRLPALATPVR